MNRLKAYIEKQEGMKYAASKKLEFSQKLYSNVEKTNSGSDKNLKIVACNESGEVLTDDVYLKLDNAYTHVEPSHWKGRENLGSCLEILFVADKFAKKLQGDLLKRTMNSSTYHHIQESSMKDLIAEWLEQPVTDNLLK